MARAGGQGSKFIKPPTELSFWPMDIILATSRPVITGRLD